LENSKKVILITPPFTQLNTPYPATAYLKGFLNTISVDSYQIDLGLEVILRIFSKDGLKKLFDYAEQKQSIRSKKSIRIFALSTVYINIIDSVILFLQGRNNNLAHKICTGNYLPEGNRFEQMIDIDWSFGNVGILDKGKYLATLFLEDISDFIIECVDENFGFSRYAERMSRSANSFDELENAIQSTNTYIDEITIEILNEKLKNFDSIELIAFSAPFPGNVYSTFRCANWIKQHNPNIPTCLGGGFANTELRSVSDNRVFKYFDYITLDDGETPIQELLKYLNAKIDIQFLKRTFSCVEGIVTFHDGSIVPDYKQAQVGTPDYTDLHLNKYISVLEIANPMHRLWSDGVWNKLTLAHGCYWGKCTFCDISLDYIKNYESNTAAQLVDRIETLIQSTGNSSFHFVDEAAPPALMKALALELIKRGINITWWTNIRFEKSFTKDLCKLLAASGCIAVSGGLEVASDRLLQLINKGVTIEQVAQVTDSLTDSGIMVHAYLMYGFPTQTDQETIDSLEIVRQLFEANVVQSAFWHQFAMTAHSPIGMNPNQFKVKNKNSIIGTFANNDLIHHDPQGADHGKYSVGLKKSLYNFMHGQCLDFPLQEWFNFKVPKTKISKYLIQHYISNSRKNENLGNHKMIFIGPIPIVKADSNPGLIFNNKREQVFIAAPLILCNIIISWLNSINDTMKSGEYLTVNSQLKFITQNFNCTLNEFLESPIGMTIQENGMLIV
jgi:radical SAM superfamily enzyme YgiQ (UPF0313 family)/uncharacterized membrane protein